MKIPKCPHCNFVWPYTGTARYKITCPNCHKTIYTTDVSAIIPVGFDPESTYPGRGVFFLEKWNDKLRIVALIRSDDGGHDLVLPINEMALNITTLTDYIPNPPEHSGYYAVPAKLQDRMLPYLF